MSWVEHTRSLIAYNEWANQKVLEAAAALNEEDFGRQVSPSHESVRMTLLHIVRVQQWWLSVPNGKPEASPLPDGYERMPLDEVRRWFTRSHDALRAYAEGLTQERLDAEVSAFNPGEGREYRWPSWQLASHLANHSSHHRAEAGIMLASLGHSPGDLDYIYFVGQRG
jgi:uncharacterized damage-inducible protein DinB